MEDRDTKGDLYEYMLGKIATAGQNGQFRTPRHIIRADGRDDRARSRRTSSATRPAAPPASSSPPASTCASTTPKSCATRSCSEHFHHGMFHGFDFDNTMLRIGSMNMLLHGVENPDIRYRDSLAQDHAGEEEKYTLVLANPPFAGSLDYENMRQGPAADRQDEEDRAALPRAVPAAAQARRPRRGHRARRRALRLVNAHKDAAQDAGRGPEARRRHLAARRRVQALRRRLHRHPALHQDQLRRHRPRLVLRRATPTAGASTTSARRCCPRTSSGRSRATRSPPTSTRRTTCPTCSPAGSERDRSEREAPAHRAELLRAEGRHRRAGLRPVASTATRRWCTTRSSTARRRRSSPTSRSWRRRFRRG